jgi:hypothetical protein
MLRRRDVLLFTTAPIGSTATALLARAQAWPTQPVRRVVTFPVGGASDSVARLITAPLGERLEHSVVVDNRPDREKGRRTQPPFRRSRRSPARSLPVVDAT